MNLYPLCIPIKGGVGRFWEACNVIAFLPPESECNIVFCDNIIQGLKSSVSCPAPAEQVH